MSTSWGSPLKDERSHARPLTSGKEPDPLPVLAGATGSPFRRPEGQQDNESKGPLSYILRGEREGEESRNTLKALVLRRNTAVCSWAPIASLSRTPSACGLHGEQIHVTLRLGI